MKLISESPISIRSRWCSVICLDEIVAQCYQTPNTKLGFWTITTYEGSIHFFSVKSNLTFVKIGSQLNIGAFSFVLFLYNVPRWPLIPDNLDENMWSVSKSSSSRSSNESKLGNSPDSLKISFYTQRPVCEALPGTSLDAIVFISIIACPNETFWRILVTLDTDFTHDFKDLRNQKFLRCFQFKSIQVFEFTETFRRRIFQIKTKSLYVVEPYPDFF